MQMIINNICTYYRKSAKKMYTFSMELKSNVVIPPYDTNHENSRPFQLFIAVRLP